MPNKLGFYLHSFEIGEHKGDLFRAIQDVRPPTLLVHAWDQVDQLRRLSPDSFIIGRMDYFGRYRRPVKDLITPWLDSDDPEARGREFAEHILTDNFETALRREGNHLLIDAWMSLNEPVPGPRSREFAEKPDEVGRRLRAYDAFQVGFRSKLTERGIEAVAFNFGAGNFGMADDYWQFFRRTLESYTYLGFHEYGWPALSTALDPGVASSAGTYQPIVAELSRRTGRTYQIILTEAGLTMMYKHPDYQDKGWLHVPPADRPIKSISQEDYWRSLAWLNTTLNRDPAALGACLFEVGHHGDWESFRHFGMDNTGQRIWLVDSIRQLALAERSARTPGALSQMPRPIHALRGRIIDARGAGVDGAVIRLTAGAETLGADPRAVVHNRGAVTWTRSITGFDGNLWNCWQKYIAPHVAGITWEEFRAEVDDYNPALRRTEGHLEGDSTYYLPENRVYPDARSAAPGITWDRPISDFSGRLYRCWRRCVQGKVAGLTWEQFSREAPYHNPSLATGDQRLHAGTEYLLPRNAGQEEYTRLAYSTGGGWFEFPGLPQGTNRVTVAADGFSRLDQAIDVTGEQDLILALDPIVRTLSADDPFVRTHGTHFVIGRRSFKFIGVNLRGLAYYDTPQMPLARAHEQLAAVRDMGARVVRIFLPHRDLSPDEPVTRLAGLLDMLKRDFPEMYLIVALTNLYGDVAFHVPGDMGYYDLRPGNEGPHILNLHWFDEGYKQHYLPFVQRIASRFRDEPAIMAWNIGNELKAESAPDLLIRFKHAIAREIRRLDPNHLITTGMISTRHAHMGSDLAKRRQLYSSSDIDFITNHAYHIDGNDRPSPEDDSDLLVDIPKPLLIEEAGFKSVEDRTGLYVAEMDRLFARGASGYMPWGFMAGGDNQDGDRDLGIDRIWHGADWDNLTRVFRARADQLAGETIDIPPATGDFAVGQAVFAAEGARLRRPAGLDGSIIHTMPVRTRVTVQGTAERRDNLRWWPVRVPLDEGRTEDGWIAQTAPSGAVLLSAV